MGENAGTVSKQEAVYTGTKRHPRISYTIDNENIGVQCSSSGKITIKDYRKIGDELIKNLSLIHI